MSTDANNKLDVRDISPEDIWAMSYVEFISLLRENNRCPGGKCTIRKIVQNTFITPHSVVLEVGSNTGFTSLEIARVANCHVRGIDPVAAAVEVARYELSLDVDRVKKLVEFSVGSAYEIKSPDNIFDVVVAGGATSFMDEKKRALSEYHRILKPWGFLSVTNLFYHTNPPPALLKRVSDTIGVNIPPWSADDWLGLFEKEDRLELYYMEKNRLEARSNAHIDVYVDHFMAKPHLQSLQQKTRDAIRERWTNTICIFNENHKYLGFLLAIFRKRYLPEEIALF